LNGLTNVDATLATLVQFDQPFSAIATIHDGTLRAKGCIHGNGGEFLHADIDLSDSDLAKQFAGKSNLMLMLNQPATLAGMSHSHWGSKEELQITLTAPLQ
jgi:hypothetical protein